MSKLRFALGMGLVGMPALALAGTGTVPEPGTWALVALAAAIGYVVSKRRK